jgi:hypothetical protein
VTTERPNLSAAFGAPRAAATPDRAAGLAAALGKRPTPAAERVTEDSATAGQSAAPSEPPQLTQPAVTPAVVQPRKTSRPTTRPQQPAAVSNVAVYLEAGLLATAKQEKRRLDITYDALVVAAFEHVSDAVLSTHFQNDESSTDTVMPVRAKRRRGDAGIQLQLRLDETQKQWLDDKQRTVGAPSRSALVAAVLRLHLFP